MLRKRLTPLIVGAFALVVGTFPARANTITLTLTSNAGGVFQYDVTLTGAQTRPNSTDTDASTVVASPGGDIFDSFTLFDFDGFVAVIGNTTGFSLASTLGNAHGAESLGGQLDSTLHDSATVTNLVFKNTAGPTITDPGGGTSLGFIRVQSLFASSANGWFTSKDSDGPGIGAGTGAGYASATVVVPIPGTPAAGPMPAAAAALPALFALVGLKRRRSALDA